MHPYKVKKSAHIQSNRIQQASVALVLAVTGAGAAVAVVDGTDMGNACAL